jgi:hypothetical protein
MPVAYAAPPPPVTPNPAVSAKRDAVCIFFLKGKCRNAENCKFLHEIIEEKIPE